jgi:hypothetical protein
MASSWHPCAARWLRPGSANFVKIIVEGRTAAKSVSGVCRAPLVALVVALMNSSSSHPPFGDAEIESVAHQLATEGAIITVCHSPCATYLVGSLRWASDGSRRLLFFAANGDGPDDGHELHFDTVTQTDAGLQFIRRDEVVGTLVPIDSAPVEDPDDYRVGWSIWQQVAPAKARFISGLLDRMEVRSRVIDGFPSGIKASMRTR